MMYLKKPPALSQAQPQALSHTQSQVLSQTQSQVLSQTQSQVLSQALTQALVSSLPSTSEADNGTLDHGTLNHSILKRNTLDHSNLDHNSLNHSKLDHNTLDHSYNDKEPSMGMSNIIRSLFENVSHPPVQCRASTSAPAYEYFASSSQSSMQKSLLPITCESYMPASNQYQSKEDNLSQSPEICATMSAACFCCEERTPAIRCLECNDVFCNDCFHRLHSDTQLKDHNVLTINRISPIGHIRTNLEKREEAKEKGGSFCEMHGEVYKFYCEQCVVFVCQDCILWIHKDHQYLPIKCVLDSCRLDVLRVIDDTKMGTKAIKAAIDRAVALSKAYEKESLDASLQIKKNMRSFIQIIEEREKYLLEKLEKTRITKLNTLSEHMNTLRGILAGLAHTSETLVRNVNAEGVELFMVKERGRAQIEYFSNMFKCMYIDEEKIYVALPNSELFDELKKQSDFLCSTASSLQPYISSTTQTRQALPPMPSLQSIQTYPQLQYNVPTVGGLRSVPEYMNNQLLARGSNYYVHSMPYVMGKYGETIDLASGYGSAIPGYWANVFLKMTSDSMNGHPIFSFAPEGQGEGQVSRPWGLCVDRESNILVADRRNNRVQVFNSAFEFKLMFGSKGTGPGEFDLPAGITTDKFGRIIVVDKDNHRVQLFTSTGGFILKFGSFGKDAGQFQYPWDVAANSLGNIVVTDTRNHRIQLFAPDGSFITQFIFESSNPAKTLKGPITPRGVCFTTSGNIVVSDFENHRLLMVDPNLTKVLLCVGREGTSLGELSRPSGITIDDQGQIIVTDSKNHRLLVFTSELRILWSVNVKSPGLDEKDRPSDVALMPNGSIIVLFETLPDTARETSSRGKQYIKLY